MVDFIRSHFEKPKKEKGEKGAYNVVQAHNYYLLTDTGRVAKSHVGIRESKDEGNVIRSPWAHQNVTESRHPGIISPFQVEHNNYILYANSGSLQGIQLSYKQARIALYQLIQTVKHMHNELHVGHFDIKPANIVLRDNGTAALIDFDGVNPIDTEGLDTIISLPPPEQLSNHIKPNTPAAYDIWALGLSILATVEPALYFLHVAIPMFSLLRSGNATEAQMERLRAKIQKVLSAVEGKDKDLADVLRDLLLFNPQSREAYFESIENHECFRELNKDAYQHKLVDVDDPPEATRENYDALKQYANDLNEKIRKLKQRPEHRSKRQHKLQLTVLRHHRNQAILNMAKIESAHSDLKQKNAFKGHQSAGFENLFIPTASQWQSTVRKHTEGKKPHRWASIYSEESDKPEAKPQTYKDIQNLLTKYETANDNDKKSILEQLTQLLDRVDASNPAISQLKRSIDFINRMQKNQDDLIKLVQDHPNWPENLRQAINDYCQTGEYIKKRTAFINIKRQIEGIDLNNEESRELGRLLRDTEYQMIELTRKADIPTYQAWKELTQTGRVRTKTTRAIDALVKKFHTPKQNRLDIAKQICKKCDEYLKAHEGVTGRTGAILHLKNQAAVFISMYAMPSTSDWKQSLQLNSDNKQTDALLAGITKSLDEFYHPDADQEKAAFKTIQKCNQYLDKMGDDAPHADAVNDLLSRAAHYLDTAQALSAKPVDHAEYTTNLGLT